LSGTTGRGLLLVDDHADTREALAELLRLHGMTVAAVERVDEAFVLAVECPPAAVLLDLVMPDGGGLELLRRLKGHATTAAVPVVVVTGMVSAESQARLAGCDAFLIKPVSLPLLLGTLAELGLGGRR
jgi:CheY-like chemotaxis protein